MRTCPLDVHLSSFPLERIAKSLPGVLVEPESELPFLPPKTFHDIFAVREAVQRFPRLSALDRLAERLQFCPWICLTGTRQCAKVGAVQVESEGTVPFMNIRHADRAPTASASDAVRRETRPVQEDVAGVRLISSQYVRAYAVADGEDMHVIAQGSGLCPVPGHEASQPEGAVDLAVLDGLVLQSQGLRERCLGGGEVRAGPATMAISFVGFAASFAARGNHVPCLVSSAVGPDRSTDNGVEHADVLVLDGPLGLLTVGFLNSWFQL